MELQDAINYADDVFLWTANSLVPDEDKLRWAMTRDTAVRETMTELMRQRWPAGLALAAALKRYEDDWKPASGVGRAGGSSQIGAEVITPGGQKGGKRKADEIAGAKQDTINSIHTKAGTMNLCYAYSLGKCKSENNCRQKPWHRCNLKTGDKRACLGKHVRVHQHKDE